MKVWSVKKPNTKQALATSKRLEIPGFLAMLLDIRGITQDKEIEGFLSENHNFTDPFLMKDMDKAVERIYAAIESQEKICVYGDYDADGVTSTSLLYSYLRDNVGADVIFYIPSRSSEGYGMNCGAIDTLKEQGVSLIVTVDNGISARDEIDYANSLGIDTVVTDHHTPSGEIPNAYAVVDVNQIGDTSPYRDLSGVGVAFKLVMALEGEYVDVDGLLDNFSDIAAMGTIGDIVPLRGENRTLVKAGIRHIQNSDRLGINAMKQEAGIADKKITSGSVSFTLVPRINAGGRLGLSDKSVELLLSEDEDEAAVIAAELGSDNTDRQGIEKEILNSINKKIIKSPEILKDKILVIDGKGWHHGVIGIVASRIKDIYDKPVIIIGIDDEGIARGSGRSVEGFSLCDAVFACSNCLTHYGGHPMAVGLSLEENKIDEFRKAINEYCKNIVMPYNKLNIDCKLNPTQLDLSLVEQIKLLEPFGCGNPSPIFGLYNMQITELRPIGNNRHMRFSLKRNDTYISALYFGLTPESCFYRCGDKVDLAVTLDKNEFRGETTLSIIIKDIKYSESINEELIDNLRIFEKFASRENLTLEEASAILPTRDDFAYVYRFLKANNGFTFSEYSLINALHYKIKAGKLRVILHAMKELGLIKWTQGLYNYEIQVLNSGKVNLDDSKFIKKLKEVH
jgi:single-stranded-DNA-specific exonuclease